MGPESRHAPNALTGKTARTLASMVLLAALCQLAPGLPVLHFMPDDATRLVPRFLRFEPDPLPWQTETGLAELAALPVDDDALLALAAAGGASGALETSGPSRSPAAAPSPTSGPSATPSAPGSRPPPAPIVLRTPYAEDTPLPPEPEPRVLEGLALMPIEDPHGVLTGFFGALDRVSAGDGLVHIVHYGDSLLTGDYVTQTLRRLLQKRFGDGGVGFALGGLPSPWYRRQNLEIEVTGEWRANRITKPHLDTDGFYGLGGVCFRPEKAGAAVEYRLPEAPAAAGGGLNGRVDRITVHAYAEAGAPPLALEVDGKRQGEIAAPAGTSGPLFVPFDLPPGARRVRIVADRPGDIRLYGVAIETRGPGIVYDGLGLDGTRAKLLEVFDAPHWFAQLRARDPALIVLHYGTNESEAADLGTKNYRQDLLGVVRKLRAGLPDVPCLLVGPMDRADPAEGGELVSRPVVQRISEVQRRVAYMEGCAFYNTYKAMGGEGSMSKWYKNHLAGGDYTHPTAAGADKLGAMIFTALMDAYKRAGRAP